MHFDLLIVGCGCAGIVIAEQAATQGGLSSLIVDRRAHIGGNCYDQINTDSGLLVHHYGPHYFRTNSDRLVTYLKTFSSWQEVEYKILSYTDGRYWQFPINLNTFEQLLGRSSTSEEMQMTLDKWRLPIPSPRNSEEMILSQVGRTLYEKFFLNYTKKQWNRDPKDLDPSVCGRIPIRTNRDDRYLSERFQALPIGGYTKLFSKMLDHPKIKVLLSTDHRQIQQTTTYRHLVYTGMVDEYFDFALGALPYRSLRFEQETLSQEYYQPAMQVNYPNDYDFTRIVEIKHATKEKGPKTTIVREYPTPFVPGSEPYYPVPAPDSKALYNRYLERALIEQEKGVSFVGRLAKYHYYNMDQVMEMGLLESQRIIQRLKPL